MLNFRDKKFTSDIHCYTVERAIVTINPLIYAPLLFSLYFSRTKSCPEMKHKSF